MIKKKNTDHSIYSMMNANSLSINILLDPFNGTHYCNDFEVPIPTGIGPRWSTYPSRFFYSNMNKTPDNAAGGKLKSFTCKQMEPW